jgi:hypothetical protein
MADVPAGSFSVSMNELVAANHYRGQTALNVMTTVANGGATPMSTTDFDGVQYAVSERERMNAWAS